VNEKERLEAFKVLLAKTIDAHREEAALSQEVVTGLGSIQRSATKRGQYPTAGQIQTVSQANDQLNRAEVRANDLIISLANSYFE